MKQEQWRFDQEAEKWNVSGGITYEEEEKRYLHLKAKEAEVIEERKNRRKREKIEKKENKDKTEEDDA